MNKPVLGILGGVGPLATTLLMQLVIEKTPAHTDQEHIPMIVFNDPQIPDRTAHILDPSQSDPLPEMTAIARRIENAGADYIAIPCNTAHFFYNSIADAVSIPVLNILEETAQAVRQAMPDAARVGLLATEGTVASGVYERCFGKLAMQTIAPDEAGQRAITSLIYDKVKAGRTYDDKDLLDVAWDLHEKDCDAVITACTELSVVVHAMDANKRPTWLFDPLEVLAERCVERGRASC